MKKQFWLLPAFAILIFSVQSCSDRSTSATHDPDKGSLEGQVITSDTQEGINNALIVLSAQNFTDQETYTENGEFQFTNLEHGEYELTVSLPQGYSENDDLERIITVDGPVSIELRADPVRQQSATIQRGTKDTLATSSGAYLSIDASNADRDIEVNIKEIDYDSFSESGVLSKPIRISIGSEGGTSGSLMSNMNVSSTENTIPIKLIQHHDGNPDDAMFMFNLGTEDEPFHTYVDGVPNIHFEPQTQKETQVLEHEFSLFADDNISFDFILKELNRTCTNSFRSLLRYDNILEGTKPLILIHGIQLGLSTCEEFQNYDPKTELFDPLIQQLQEDDVIRQNYSLYVYKYTSNTSVVYNSEALWEMMSEWNIENPVIIAHSMGGLVARDMMIQEGDDAVTGLITLGTPHEGSPVADLVFQSSLSFETACEEQLFFKTLNCRMSRMLTNLAPRTDGLRDLRTDSNLIFNLKSNESSSDKVFTVGGTLDDSFDWGTYYNRLTQFGSHAVYEIGYTFMGGESNPNDGLVPLSGATPEWTGLRSELVNHNHSEIARGKNNNASIVFEAIRPTLIQFLDVSVAPQLTTKDITNISSTSAESGGQISNDGGSQITDRGVCWSSSQNPTLNANCTSDGSGVGEFTSYLTGLSPDTQYFVRAYASNSAGTVYGNQKSFTTDTEDNGNGNGNGDWPRDTETQVVEVTNPATGRVWMDRNLGASRAATAMDDEQAYGDLYQWGRAADGHQKRNSGITGTLSSTDTPGHGDFILAPNWPYDWRSPQNDNLWQGVNGVNNPCPDGYRLPTEAEWEAERENWNSNDRVGAFESPLKLTVAGYRNRNGSIITVGFGGTYWSGTTDGIDSRPLGFSSNASMGGADRSNGCSVRCIKN